MNRIQNRLLLFVLSFFLINVAFSQTLYWIGGSGNFNDAKHWSLNSGGSPSNIVPSNSNEVVIDDNSGGFNVSIKITGTVNIKSLKAINSNNRVDFTGDKLSSFSVFGSFELNAATSWNYPGSLNFVSVSLNTNQVAFGIQSIPGDLRFNNGKYKISNIFQSPGAKTYFDNGTYIFRKTSLSVSELFISGASTSFVIDTTYFLVKNKLIINNKCDFKTNKFSFYAPFSDPAMASIPGGMTFGSITKLADNSIMSVCDATIKIVPECSGPCTGIFSYTLDPSCASGPYSIIVTNANPAVNCQNTANNLSLNNIAMTGTVLAACDCPGSQYNIVILDGSSFPIPGTIYINGSNTSNFNFNPPSFNLVTLGSKAPTCNASCNGTLSLVASGGFGPYTITVLPAVAGPFLTAGGFTVGALCGNVYTFTINDKNGCSGVITKTVVAPSVVSTGSVTTNVPCFGACTGSLLILPSGGNPGNYTVSFSFPPGGVFTVAPAGSASVTNLCPGAISATVTDSKGCFITTSTVIAQPPQLTVTPTHTNLSCFSICNGAASVAVSGGVAPYVYVWSPGPSASNSISGLCAGTQTVSIFDAHGCPTVQTFNILSPPAITLTLNQKNVTCNSLCNGSATVQTAGGSGAITFTWTGPAPFVASSASVITNLCPGVYTLTAHDALNCPATQTINITQPPPATITANVTNNTCFLACAGSATVSVSGGNGAPYSFTWTPATASAVAGATTTASSLCQGNYTISAKDASACPTSVTITITQPASITPNAISTSVTCNGSCNGSITAAPVGGSGGPYTFTLVTPLATTIVAAPPYTNLCAGNYTLSVKDVSACVTSTVITIAQPNPLAPSIGSVNITCFNACNGSLAGSVLGGTPGYTLVWTTPSGTVAGGNIINQCAGNYTFMVTDSHQCTVALTCTLTQPADITTNSVITNPTCNGNCNGIISTTVAGGTPGYTLNWSNGGPNPNILLCANVYTLVVVDSKGCTKTFTAGVLAPPALSISIVTASTSCAGTCDGSATVTASGGTGLLTYQFNTLPLPTTNTTGIISGLCAGAYIVSVTDANGCSLPQAFNISSPPLLTAAITGIIPTCNVCTGASTVTVAGGTPGYTVIWTNTVPIVVANGTTAANLCLGNYTANVVDTKGCTAKAFVTILNSVSVTVITGGSPILCFGACNASATANAIGGTAPYTYTWNSAPQQTTQVANNLCAGPYTVTVQDLNHCSNTGTINITQPTSVTVNSSQTNVPCFAGCSGVITTTVSGGTPPYTYSWSPGGQTTTSLTNLCVGTYTVNIKDLNNCSQNFTFAITQNPSITAVFTATSPTGCFINNGTITAVVSGGSGGGYTFTWSPGAASVVVGATTTATGLGAGSYSLFIKDGAGCTASLSTNLSSPAGPTVNVATTSISCFGGATGAATAVASGVGPFTFTWSPATTSAVVGATTTATNLSAGIYNINVKDNATGCLTSQTLNIASPSAATITSNVFPALCSAACNGSITTTIAGGTPPYVTFSWLPAAPPITGQGTGTVSNLCVGNYTLNLTDNNGCVTTKSFVITQPTSLTITATQTNVLCNAASNGAISLTVTGGSPGYTYTWTPVGTFTGSANSAVNGLPPNVYTVTVKDINNCSIIQTFTITQPAVLGQTINITNLTCNSFPCNGTASIVVSGGTPTYSFSWSNGPATTQSINALCAGNYTGTVKDANGCISSLPFVITQPAVISITTTPTQPKCNGQCNGSITTNVAGGNGGYTYAWVPAGAGPNPSNLCPNNYTLTVTDASLCTSNAVVTLTNPPLVIANVSFTNPSCSANCNGIAISNPLNTTAPVNYTWTTAPTQSTQSVNNLCAGTYSVFISDFNGCTDVQQVVLTNPPSLTVNPSTQPATCGNSNGTITIAVSGGTPTYAILWIPSAITTSFINNVPAGIYTVAVTDQNGCTNTITIPLSNSNGPSSAVITQTNVNCFGQCTGAASIGAIVGGTPGYIRSWVTPPSASTVNPQSNLCAGTYTAQIKDANNCLLFQSITITQNPSINDNPVITNAKCIGICSGSIVLTPTGGVAPYVSYQWSPSLSTTNTATGLCVGVQSATITDNLGCKFTATYNVAGQTTITGVVASSSNICFGNCLGSSTVVATAGGIAPYTYNWSNFQNGVITNNLCNGTYSVVITDNQGCKNTFTTSITSPSSITLVPTIASPSCGMCNGSSTITALGGTPTYSYAWSSGGTAAVENSLCAGLYQVLITDNNGCTQLQNVPISNSSGITGETFNIQNELCFNACNGALTVTPIGGTPPITYSWISPISNNNFVTNLCGGTYFVQMTDAQGCIRTSSASVSSATNMNITPTILPPTCNFNNGTVAVNVTGGSGVYTYTWLPAGNSATLANIGAGIYTLSVNDGNCTKTVAVTVNNSNAPVIFSTKIDNACAGNPCIGSVVITPTLGTPAYSTIWSNGNITKTVTNLCQGIITVTVTDAALCKAVQSFSISQDPAINLSLPMVSQIKCFADCNGTINLVPSGGTLPYVISWIPATTVVPTNPLPNLCAGNYTGIVTDSKGCSISSSINIASPLPYSLTANITNATCNSSTDGAATTTVSGGTPAYTYSWSGPATFTTQSISNIGPGTYTYSIIDSKGCQKDTTMVIASNFTILANAGRDTSFCTNNNIILNGNNSINAATYSWSLAPANSFIANTSTTSVLPAVGTNSYVLLVTSTIAICFDYDTVVINVNPLPIVDAGPTQSISLFTSTGIGGNPTSLTGITYTWSPTNTLNNPSIPNPVASNTVNTIYTVMVTDAKGCVNTNTVEIFIYPEIKIPNGFSPNADGRNDFWILDNIQQFPNCVVEVYNRWGELLFHSVGYGTPFDGKYDGKDLPVGTYYYLIDLKHFAYTKPYTGPLTIFR